MSEFITIGEPLAVLCSMQIDKPLSTVTDFKRVVGGSELNVAIGVKRLGHSVEYISKIGNDPQGQFIKNRINELGVGHKYLRETDNYFTGYQMKELISKGDPFVYNFRKNSATAHLSLPDIKDLSFENVKIVHLTGIFPALSPDTLNVSLKLEEQLNQKEVLLTFDPNLRPALWPNQDVMVRTINKLAERANIVLPGQNEGKILTGSDDPEKIADFYLKNDQTKVVFVKVGSKGSFVKDKKGFKKYVEGFKAEKVVDTVGAGDGYALGVITALLENLSYEAAAQRGNAIGCLQVQVQGDNDGYPTSAGLKEFYRENGVFNG